MHDQLKDRILRKLEALSDERGYQLLDYLEFLESKYAERAAPSNIFAKLKEKAEDTLRAGKFSAETIGKTVGAMDSAQKIVKGIVAAGEAAIMGRRPRAESTLSTIRISARHQDTPHYPQ